MIKLKAFADDKLKVTKMMIFLFDRAENTVGKGENAGYPHFLLFPQYFPRPSSCGKELPVQFKLSLDMIVNGRKSVFQHFICLPKIIDRCFMSWMNINIFAL